MKCNCGKLPEEFNYCPVCSGVNPDRDGSTGAVVFCKSCGKPIPLDDNFCWNCREPNRFKMAAILFEMKARNDTQSQ